MASWSKSPLIEFSTMEWIEWRMVSPQGGTWTRTARVVVPSCAAVSRTVRSGAPLTNGNLYVGVVGATREKVGVSVWKWWGTCGTPVTSLSGELPIDAPPPIIVSIAIFLYGVRITPLEEKFSNIIGSVRPSYTSELTAILLREVRLNVGCDTSEEPWTSLSKI